MLVMMELAQSSVVLLHVHVTLVITVINVNMSHVIILTVVLETLGHNHAPKRPQGSLVLAKRMRGIVEHYVKTTFVTKMPILLLGCLHK